MTAHNFIDLAGKIFGYWKVLYRVQDGRRGATRWLCKCECGIEKEVTSSTLRNGESKSCGRCGRTRAGKKSCHWVGRGKLSQTKFGKIRLKALSRNIKFNITIEDAWRQFELQNGICQLTGRKLNIKEDASLDRIDSSLPYIDSNIQWIHKHANIAKNVLQELDFINLCRDVAQYTANRVIRPWGYYSLLANEKDYSIKILFINPGEETSLQRHSKRHELITLLDGSVRITHKDYTFEKGRAERASSYRILAGEWHRFAAPASQKEPTVILEVAYGELDPDDFERKEDKYNRERLRGPGFVDRVMDNTDWRKR